MGLFSSKQPVTATYDGKHIACLICGSEHFMDREVKLNTTGAELFDFAWANASATGLVCIGCGYVHEFFGDAIQLWKLNESAD